MNQAPDLVLSIRGANLARRVGAVTVGDLVLFSEMELLSAKCFGETSLREIKEALAARGLRLGMTPSQVRGLPGTQARVVARSNPTTAPQAAEEEHEGDCCGHCADAARKLRERMESRTPDQELERKLNMSLAELELSVRATNSLEMEGIITARQLVSRTAEELLEVRGFGEPLLREVSTKLAERGLSLGMLVPVE